MTDAELMRFTCHLLTTAATNLCKQITVSVNQTNSYTTCILLLLLLLLLLLNRTQSTMKKEIKNTKIQDKNA